MKKQRKGNKGSDNWLALKTDIMPETNNYSPYKKMTNLTYMTSDYSICLVTFLASIYKLIQHITAHMIQSFIYNNNNNYHDSCVNTVWGSSWFLIQFPFFFHKNLWGAQVRLSYCGCVIFGQITKTCTFHKRKANTPSPSNGYGQSHVIHVYPITH